MYEPDPPSKPHLSTPRAESMREGHVIDGKYILDARIGQGGMGQIFLARQRPFNRRVAIKTLHPSLSAHPVMRERFFQEAYAVSRLQHPHTVSVYDYGQTSSGEYFIVMEYIEGETLARWIQTRGALPLDEAVAFLVQIAQALGEAHALGIIHRDLKPENVMVVRPASGDPFVKVLDFGIAKLSAAPDDKLTQHGALVGTPAYMSPEQASGGEVDNRSDLYALGCLFYAMLTGREPFMGDSALEILSQHQRAPVPMLPEALPSGLNAFLLRVMAKRSERRPATAQELIMELFKSLGPAPGADVLKPSLARPSATPDQPSPSRPIALKPSTSHSNTIFSALPHPSEHGVARSTSGVEHTAGAPSAHDTHTPPADYILEELVRPSTGTSTSADAPSRAELAMTQPSLAEAEASESAEAQHVELALRPLGDAHPLAIHLSMSSAPRRDAPSAPEPTAAGGLRALHLSSEPAGALITIDGRPVGRAPMTFHARAGTTLDVSFAHGALDPLRFERIEVFDDRDNALLAVLQPSAVQLHVRAPLPGCELLINGDTYGVLPANRTRRIEVAWPNTALEVVWRHPEREDHITRIPTTTLRAEHTLAPQAHELPQRV